MTAIFWPASFLLAVAVICFSALRAWRGWIELKRQEMDVANILGPTLEPSTAARIEYADLRERLRKLEAIATGVDL